MTNLLDFSILWFIVNTNVSHLCHKYCIVFQIVFGTGDLMKAVTVSANLGFLRAARSQVTAREPVIIFQ